MDRGHRGTAGRRLGRRPPGRAGGSGDAGDEDDAGFMRSCSPYLHRSVGVQVVRGFDAEKSLGFGKGEEARDEVGNERRKQRR
uniref:Uncharacterized protein n=1 Tax=Oryza sativa subsp. japonica TaxID=39947 RepID=Q6Z7V8_ORYSJ|nr:hypothetical protein [Oryza sativa Japonica Group]